MLDDASRTSADAVDQVAPAGVGAPSLARKREAWFPAPRVFDPVLCELVYRWYCPAGGLVIDPCAGGAVRGIVASRLGRQYVGVELRAEQIGSNARQAEAICAEPMPFWIQGDARGVDVLLPFAMSERGAARACDPAVSDGPELADLLFTAAPWVDVEVYSDDPLDLSTLAYADFREVWRVIVERSVGRLRSDRFAVVAVEEARAPGGSLIGLVADTIGAFRAAGCSYVDELLLVERVASHQAAAAKQFGAWRRVPRTHTHVLVFAKGDPAAAGEACAPVDIDGRALDRLARGVAS